MNPSGVSPHIAEAAAKMIDAERHHLAVPDRVREATTEGEERGEREQVSVHRPLDTGARETELLLYLWDRDRHDRLVDEGHGDGEDHRREDEVPRSPSRRGGDCHEFSLVLCVARHVRSAAHRDGLEVSGTRVDRRCQSRTASVASQKPSRRGGGQHHRAPLGDRIFVTFDDVAPSSARAPRFPSSVEPRDDCDVEQ